MKDEMEAGRLLDATVAEVLFGWKWIRFKYERGGADGPEEAIQVAPEDFPGFFDERSYMSDDGKYPRSYHPRGRPRYSEDIAAAWLVVERLRSDRFAWCCIDLHSNFHCQWVCGLIRYREDDSPEAEAHEYDFVGKAETAPHAICLAALAALNAGEKDE